jgi:hypothetical protein
MPNKPILWPRPWIDPPSLSDVRIFRRQIDGDADPVTLLHRVLTGRAKAAE